MELRAWNEIRAFVREGLDVHDKYEIPSADYVLLSFAWVATLCVAWGKSSVSIACWFLRRRFVDDPRYRRDSWIIDAQSLQTSLKIRFRKRNAYSFNSQTRRMNGYLEKVALLFFSLWHFIFFQIYTKDFNLTFWNIFMVRIWIYFWNFRILQKSILKWSIEFVFTVGDSFIRCRALCQLKIFPNDSLCKSLIW